MIGQDESVDSPLGEESIYNLAVDQALRVLVKVKEGAHAGDHIRFLGLHLNIQLWGRWCCIFDNI